MAISFGNTWWGQQWLGALDKIDYSNRLPRGKSYANKGAVTSIKIKGNQIEAKVQGTRKTPYKVHIVVPPFYEEHTSVFLDAIKSNPLVLAKLLNRELPQELMNIAQRNGIKIFPESWQDIKLSCSCPDWAVPCKHLASVIYIIANEIDKNPFLVFKLHNFDILEHLKDIGDVSNPEEKQPIPTLAKMAIPLQKVKEEFIPNLEAANNLDFSLIQDISKQILTLFPEKTLFFNGDFHKLLSSYYRNKIKEINKGIQAKDNDFQEITSLRNSRITFVFKENNHLTIRYKHPNEDIQEVSLSDLCRILQNTSSKHIHNYSPHFFALYHVFHFCQRLLVQGAILPQLLNSKEDKFYIRWIPALINNEVKQNFDFLLQLMPPDFCVVETENKTSKTAKTVKIVEKSLPIEESLKTVSASLLDHYFKSEQLPAMNMGSQSAVSHNEKVASLFFLPVSQTFDAFTEKEIPNSIQLWLNRFNIARKEIAPILAIDEREDSFECHVLVENKEKPLAAPFTLKEFLSKSHHSESLELIKDLTMLGEYMPELEEYIQTSGESVIRYNDITVVDLLQRTLPALELFGIRILLPKSLQNILKPQLSIKIKNRGLKSYLSLDELLDFDWRIALGEHLISEDEFRNLSKNAGKLIRIKNSYAFMTEDEIRKIIKSLSTSRDISSLKLLQSALSEEYDGAKIEIDESLRKEIKKLLHTDDIAIPEELHATLRPYQHRGYSWMYKNAKLGFGSLLADDMGLGKTLQIITILLKFKSEMLLKNRPALIVVPTTLLSNWEKEIQRFAPSLNTYIHHGSNRNFVPKEIKQHDVILTSYGVARSDVALLKKQDWHALIIDEAQNIKNSETAQTKAVKQLKAKIKIAMSGTPVENRLSEYWSIFDFSNAGYLGNLPFFTEYFSKPIELNRDKKKLETFRKVTQPFILRREKTDKSVINDLPDKIENNQYCLLSPEQTSLYNKTIEEIFSSVENADGVERQGLVLKLLSALKQICNHPSQYLKKDDLTTSLSGKTEMLLELLDTIYDAGEKVLIFSQYAEMGAMLLNIIYEHYGKKPLFLHGGCSRKQRDEMVHDFQNQPDADTFILSLKAGGTGLNLTEAANVIHYDLWWNPAVEAQATDRAFRIGQKNNVMVHRFITKNTLEEKIDTMIQSKKELANLTVAKGESWIGNMSDKDLKELITLSK